MDLFEKIFVINLKRRPDRRARMEARLKDAQVGCPVEVFDAIDARDLSPEYLIERGHRTYASWNDPRARHFSYTRELKYGEIACSLSHLAVWERVRAEGVERALVLEDDVTLCSDFLDRSTALAREVPADMELLYLGRGALRPDVRLSPRLVTPGFSHGAFAYVLSLGCARKLLETGFHRNIVPVDEFLPVLYSGDGRRDVRVLFAETRLVTYAADPRLVAHDPKTQSGSDTEASSFEPRDAARA